MPTASRKIVERMPNGFDPDTARVATLNELITVLNERPAGTRISDSEFSAIFARAVKTLELDDAAITKMIGISRPTNWRWQNGESAPVSLMRPVVFRTLRKDALRKLRVHTPNL
jgi:hypothetical protein